MEWYLKKYYTLNSKIGHDRKAWLKQLIIENKIYLSKYDELDDHTEFSPKLEKQEINQDFLQLLQKAFPLGRIIPKILFKKLLSTDNQGKAIAIIQRNFKERIKIYSFSGSFANDEKMWNEYADSHTGVRIDFSFDKVQSACHHYLVLEKVKYNDNRSVRIINFDDDSLRESFINPSILMKNNRWLYQDEWRLIRLSKVGTPYLILPTNTISRVILGRHISNQNKEYIKHLINISDHDISLCQGF